MCGIIGYVGTRNPETLLFQGLKNMEYRGYDSAGIVSLDEKNKVHLARAVGEVQNLSKHIKSSSPAHMGIGHTRWATHGGVEECNTHPHYSHDKSIYLVHNGIIENYAVLKKDLEKKGVKFYGQTDSEVLANLIGYYYRQCGALKQALTLALEDVTGTYGLVVMTPDNPDELIAVKSGSPLILGIADHGLIIASDTNAFSIHTTDIVYLNDGEVLTLTKGGNYSIESLSGKKVSKEIQKIEAGAQSSGKGDYEHYMLKEIMEQPDVIKNTIRGRLNFETGRVNLGGITQIMPELLKKKKLIIVACGTSSYAGMVGKNFFAEIADMECEVHIASEFRYQKNFWSDDTAVIAISQSGETADTMAAVKEANHRGILTLGIVNVPGSSIAQMTDAGIFTHAGKEIGVASTKAFVGQITALFMMALAIGERKHLDVLSKGKYLKEFSKIPDAIKKILKNTDNIQKIAGALSKFDHVFFLGRYYQLPIAHEGALKFKEITYAHAEAYPAGELKHGPLALIDKDHPTVLLDPTDALEEKTGSAREEVEARKGKVFRISDDKKADIVIPKTIDLLYPFLTVIPCQLLSYYAAKKLGREIDKPRNLAKSVTVE